MSNRSMATRDTSQFLHTQTPAIVGDEVERSLDLQSRLTEEALRCRNSIRAAIFQSDLTNAVRTTEREIVIEQLQTKQGLLRYLNESVMTMFRTSLNEVVTYGVAHSVADTSSRLLARRVSLEEEFKLSSRRFCESVVEEKEWAASMPPAIRKLAEKKIDDSLDGFFAMMETMRREFEALVDQKIGGR